MSSQPAVRQKTSSTRTTPATRNEQQGLESFAAEALVNEKMNKENSKPLTSYFSSISADERGKRRLPAEGKAVKDEPQKKLKSKPPIPQQEQSKEAVPKENDTGSRKEKEVRNLITGSNLLDRLYLRAAGGRPLQNPLTSSFKSHNFELTGPQSSGSVSSVAFDPEGVLLAVHYQSTAICIFDWDSVRAQLLTNQKSVPPCLTIPFRQRFCGSLAWNDDELGIICWYVRYLR